jgi:hypothetical protein
MRKHVLSDRRYPGIESMKDPVVILPIGATEARSAKRPAGSRQKRARRSCCCL